MQECDSNLETAPVTEMVVTKPSGFSQIKVVLAYLFCGLIWGTTWYAIRICVAPDGFSTFIAVAIRFSLATVLFAAGCFIYRKQLRKPNASELLWISFCGLISAIGYLLLYIAEKSLAGGLCAVLSATSPLLAGLLAAFTGVERLSKTIVVGSIIAFFGVLLVFLDRLQISPAQASAACLVILMCCCSASSNTGLKKHAHHVPALVTTTIFFSATSFILWLGAAITGNCSIPNPLPLLPTVALLYLTIFGTFLTFTCYFYLLKHVRLSTAMSLSFVTPIVALIVDGFLEKQAALSLMSYAGIAVVLVGVGLCMLVQFRAAQNSRDQPVVSAIKNQKAA